MKIVRLQAENVKRLRAVDIAPDPDAPVVTISGENGEGKTSLLDSIAYALGGKRLICERPIRDGQPSAFVEVDLGEIIVRRTWTRGRESELEVRAANGQKMRSPQAVLDLIAGSFTFDPLAFARADARRQLEVLRELVGLDFSEHDAKKRTLFEDRTEVGRAVRHAEARLATMPVHEGVPDAEISVVQLTEDLEARLRAGAEIDRRRAEHAETTRTRLAETAAADRLSADIVRLQNELADRRQRAAELARQEVELERACRETPRPDPAPIREAIARAQDLNRRVREQKDRRVLEGELAELRAQQSAMTLELDALDARKRAQIEAAKFPVPGLALGEDGVTLHGIPLAQASEAERLRVSVAMGLASNPTLQVMLVRDGSGLDRKSERMLAEMAAAAGAQVWLETTKEGPGYLVIADGQVVEG